MAVTVELEQAAERLSEYVAVAEAGGEVILTSDTVPRAKLIPISAKRTTPRIPGLHPGIARTTDDFDDPLPDSFWLGEE